MSGRIEEARAHYANAAGLASGVSEYSYNEGIACLLTGRLDESAAALQRSLDGDTLLREAHYWAWAVLDALGVKHEAITELRKALYHDPAQHNFAPVSNRLELGSVTLCAVDCKLPDLAARSLRRSMAQCRFAEAKLFTSRAGQYEGIQTVYIDDIQSIEEYSQFIMRSLARHVDTQFALVTQWDGYVINASAWSEDFLNYDYVGAKLENPIVGDAPQTYSVGNGGFSLRSDIFMGAGSDPRILMTHPEDTHMCGTYRGLLEHAYGIRFADEAVADRFSFEIVLPDRDPFGFHGFFNLCFFEDDPRWMRFGFLGPGGMANALC